MTFSAGSMFSSMFILYISYNEILKIKLAYNKQFLVNSNIFYQHLILFKSLENNTGLSDYMLMLKIKKLKCIWNYITYFVCIKYQGYFKYNQ